MKLPLGYPFFVPWGAVIGLIMLMSDQDDDLCSSSVPALIQIFHHLMEQMPRAFHSSETCPGGVIGLIAITVKPSVSRSVRPSWGHGERTGRTDCGQPPPPVFVSCISGWQQQQQSLSSSVRPSVMGWAAVKESVVPNNHHHPNPVPSITLH
ncbi:hypothetical protein GPALN_004123 [Globodera pallida]|nr:hypothetical protein GPALN_004123 [Globodera pallida]